MRRVLDYLPAELMHRLAPLALHTLEKIPAGLFLLERLGTYRGERVSSPHLRVKLAENLTLENPVGVAAGLIKGHGCMGLWTLGASAVSTGGFVERPQPGNKKPRLRVKRNEQRGIVALNHMGFPQKETLDRIAFRLQAYRGSPVKIGVNIGKHADVSEDKAHESYGRVVAKLYECADYFEINVSSPNTPGMRDLQNRTALERIVIFAIEIMNLCGGVKPMLVKISPDLSTKQLDGVIRVAVDHGLLGIIASNSSVNAYLKSKYNWRGVRGGFSGDDPQFRYMSTSQIKYIRRETKGSMVVIGCGGINSPDAAIEKIKAGAWAVQILTGLRDRGLILPSWINAGILDCMDREGIKNFPDMIGVDAA